MYDICTLEIDFDFQIFDISDQSFEVRGFFKYMFLYTK